MEGGPRGGVRIGGGGGERVNHDLSSAGVVLPHVLVNVVVDNGSCWAACWRVRVCYDVDSAARAASGGTREENAVSKGTPATISLYPTLVLETVHSDPCLAFVNGVFSACVL